LRQMFCRARRNTSQIAIVEHTIAFTIDSSHRAQEVHHQRVERSAAMPV
jgi:hypothetical protein